MATRPKRRKLKANPAHRYTVTLYPYAQGRPGMVKISPSTGHGFWEYPDGSEGGELTVQTVIDPRTGAKTLELLDYHGSYALPGRVREALEGAGVIVGNAFDPVELPRVRRNPDEPQGMPGDFAMLVDGSYCVVRPSSEGTLTVLAIAGLKEYAQALARYINGRSTPRRPAAEVRPFNDIIGSENLFSDEQY